MSPFALHSQELAPATLFLWPVSPHCITCSLCVVAGHAAPTTVLRPRPDQHNHLSPSLRSIPYIVYLVAGAIGVAGAYVVYLHGKARWQVPGLETSTWVSRLHAGAHAGQPPLSSGTSTGNQPG